MSNAIAVHYVFRPSDTAGHYDEALFVEDGPFPAWQFDNHRSLSNAVLENMPLTYEWDPDFINVKPRPSGLVEARISSATGFLNKHRRS